MKFNLDTKFK